MLPAVGQGAIGVTCRSDDDATRARLDALNDLASATAIACERAFLARLDGSCKTPIAGYAEIENGRLRFRGLILTPDGSEWFETELIGGADRAEGIGTEAGDALLAARGPRLHRRPRLMRRPRHQARTGRGLEAELHRRARSPTRACAAARNRVRQARRSRLPERKAWS